MVTRLCLLMLQGDTSALDIIIEVNVTLLERRLILGTIVEQDVCNLLKMVNEQVVRPGMVRNRFERLREKGFVVNTFLKMDEEGYVRCHFSFFCRETFAINLTVAVVGS